MINAPPGKSCYPASTAGYGQKEATEIMDNNFQKTSELKLTDREAKLLAIIRKMDFGEVRVVVTDGIPTRVEEIKKSIKL